jgi:hypothetical protein
MMAALFIAGAFQSLVAFFQPEKCSGVPQQE